MSFIKNKFFVGIILLIIGFISGWYAYQIKNLEDISRKLDTDQEQAGQYVGNLYKNMNTDLYVSIQEKDFVNFAITEIEKKCPFYKPDGVTYRGCLSDWEESLVSKSMVEQVDEVHAYCSNFTKRYADETSHEGTELFLKCSIYKLQ